MSSVPVETARVGFVVRPHGIHGETVVQPADARSRYFRPEAVLWVGDPPEARAVESVRPHQGRWLVHFRDVRDRDAAEALRGAVIRVEVDDLDPLDDGEHFVHDLVGCALLDAAGTVVGTVSGVVPGGPHDLLEVTTDDATALVPMVRDWLLSVDIAGRRIEMRLPRGTIEHSATTAARKRENAP